MKKKKVRVYMPKAQEGMEAPQQAQQQAPPQDAAANQMQQVMQMVEQMVQQGAQPHDIVMALLQQGVPPEAVGQILVQMGMPQEQVAQVIQEVMQSAQGQGQEQGQPMMAYGGEPGNPVSYISKEYLPEKYYNLLQKDVKLVLGDSPTDSELRAYYGTIPEQSQIEYFGSVQFPNWAIPTPDDETQLTELPHGMTRTYWNLSDDLEDRYDKPGGKVVQKATRDYDIEEFRNAIKNQASVRDNQLNKAINAPKKYGGEHKYAEGGMAGDPPTKNDLGSFYKHPERPDYTFMYTKNGWFMLDDKLGDTWQPIHDPDGTWAEKLNNEASKTAYQGGSGSNAVGTGRSGLSRTLTNYAEGGQAGQIEQLVMAYAQLQAQEQGIDNPEEIRQLAMQVMSQLQNAESQDQQQSILESMQAALQDAQMPSEPQTQEQLAMMLGGTAKDFQTIAKERIKQYRAGGITDPESLDASSTNAYVNGLTKSLESAMRSGHLIGKMRNDMGAISNMFDQLPTADNGFEVTDEELAAHSMSRGTWEGTDDATKMQIADAILADRGEDLSTNPFRKASEGNYDADGNFTGGDDFTPTQGSDDINRPLTDEELLEARNLGINDPSFSPGSTRNQILQAKRNAYIDAQMQGAPNPNVPSGTQGYDVNNPYYQGAPGKQQHYYPGWNAQGTGQGDPTTRLLNAMGVDPNSPQAKFRGKGEFRGASIDDMIKALGSTHQATNFRVKDRLFGGKKIKFDTILRDQPAGTPGTESEKSYTDLASISEARDRGELSREDYWREVEKLQGRPTPESERNKISGTVHPDAGEPQYIDNPQDKWDRQHNRRIKRQQKREGTYTRNFEDNYTDSELMELYGNDEKGLIKALEKRRKKGIGTYGVQENSKRTAESMRSGDEKARNAAIKAGLGDKPESEYTEADWDAWEAVYEYEYGGAVTWDPVKMRFLPRAAGGASITTQGDFWGDVKEGLGTMGQYMDTLGPAAVNFLDAMNQYQSAEQMKPFQSIDAIANVVPTGSGVEGIYADNMRRQMPQDMGEQSMLSGQTDVGTFGQNQRFFSGDIVPQNYAFFGRYGGEKKKAATGMSVGSDHILNDGQIAMLEKLGYKLKLRQ